MRAPIILLADFANTSGSKLNVMGVFTDILATAFPARHHLMYLVTKIILEVGDVAGQHTLTVKLLDQDGGAIMGMEGMVEFPKVDAGRQSSVQLVMALPGLEFKQPGSYEFSVLIDGEPIDSAALHVSLRPPQA